MAIPSLWIRNSSTIRAASGYSPRSVSGGFLSCFQKMAVVYGYIQCQAAAPLLHFLIFELRDN
jgi:hypothetical protein